MNRQLLTVGIAIVVLVLIGVTYSVLRTTGPAGPETPPITGADRAEDARGIIANIEQAPARTVAEPAVAPVPEPAAALVPEPAAAPEPTVEVVAAVTPPPPDAQGGAPDLDEAFEQAQAFQRTGQLADAQLLYFFGARRGHAPSAFELGAMNDPNHHSPETSLLPDPDPFQAYRWYSAARDQGVLAAAERLEALREWAVEASAAGDTQADQLLLQWR